MYQYKTLAFRFFFLHFPTYNHIILDIISDRVEIRYVGHLDRGGISEARWILTQFYSIGAIC